MQETHERRVRGRVLLCSVLLAMTMAWNSVPFGNAQETELQTEPTTAAFTAARHADTIDTHGPYRVSLRQLAGREVTGGKVVFSVWTSQRKKIVEGQATLRHAKDGETWTAEISGQPIGSIITYHFSLTTRAGEALRHPARAPASYRFRVVPVRLLSVTLPKYEAGAVDAQLLTLRIQATSPPSGEMFLRLLSSSSDVPQKHRIALSMVKPQKGENASSTYVMNAMGPRLQPGELLDFYFEILTAKGAKLRIPADAPVRVYSIRKPVRHIEPLHGDEAFVLDIGSIGRQRWIGLKGGGAWVWEGDNPMGHWGLDDGLPSGVARFVLPDSVSGHVYVGTDRGVVAIKLGENSLVSISVPYPSAWEAELEALNRLGRERRAGPGALSTLDGTLLFQLQSKRLLGEAYPVAVFLQLRDGQLSEWLPPAKFPLVGLSSATFDAVDGCWLLGGVVSHGGQDLRPTVVRRCGELVDRVLLQDFVVDESQAIPARVVAMARDPSSGNLVVGLEFHHTNDPHHRKNFGVYRVEDTSGRLSPLVSESAAIGAEVTSVATDWTRGRILVGTFGHGLWQFQNGVFQRLSRVKDVHSEITTIEVNEERGSVLVGTSHGAFELAGDEVKILPLVPHGNGAILTDALPMDVDPATGRVLLSSYSQGLAALEREKSGRWRAVENLRPEHELPGGLFGDAQYTSTGGVSVIIHSQGLLQLENKRMTLLGPADGLYSTHLLRLLALRSGEIWFSHTPMPFGKGAGAALQMVQNGKVIHTVEIPDRNLATIGRWIEVPERKSVFAATRAGVVEFHKDGTVTRLSRNSASSIARDPHTGLIGAVGTAVERWDGERFIPVLFRVDHPRWPRGRFYAGAPIDLAIDRDGTWYLLFREGILVLLDSEGNFVGLMDPEDGIPPTARRLLAHPATGDIFVGSSGEGPVVVFPDGRS